MARVRSVGWRSARWYGTPATAGAPSLAVQQLPATPGAAPGVNSEQPAGTGVLDERYLVSQWPWVGVRWSLAYIAFLTYVFVVTSYTLPIGTAAMLAVLFGCFLGERVRLTPVGVMLCLFLVVGGISYAGSDWKPFTNEILSDLAKMVLVFLSAQVVLDSKERLRFFLFFYLFAFAFYPIRGSLFNYFIYHETVEGRAVWNQQFADPNDLAALLLLPMSLGLGLLTVERNKKLRFLAMGSLIFIPFVLALAQSRGAMLAFLAGAGLLFLRNKRAQKMMLVGAGVIAIVFVTLAPDQLWKRMSSLEQVGAKGAAAQAVDEGSMEQRLEIWKVSTIVIKEHPVLGVGPGSYPFAHVFAARDPEVLDTAGGLRDAHSTYFTLMAEYGVIGFAIWIGFVLMILKKADGARRRLEKRLPRHAQQLLMAEIGLISWGIAAVFGTWIIGPFTYIGLAILWAMAESGEKLAVDMGIA
ncbi:MAG: hypothetical protein MNPFHGCM_02068 [Gemmatimonadaceae bacterium]|nr:hypothetical protein [Gemmatimonadaceae bacterium]